MEISIATSAMNAERTIGYALFGVASQLRVSPEGRKFALEHVVVDASPNDAMEKIADRFPTINRWLREPDRGIYDGMNKAIGLASGEIVGILNADDFYFRKDTVGRVADAMADPTVEACFGNVAYVHSEDPVRVVRAWESGSYDAKRFRRGWMPPHPAFFVRRSCYERYGVFREDIGSAADYELMLRFLMKARLNAVVVPEMWIAMRTGGQSNASIRRRINANAADRRAWTINGMRPPSALRLLKPARKLPQFLPRRGRHLRDALTTFRADYEQSMERSSNPLPLGKGG